MKILHIGKFYPPYFGGIEKVNYDLVEGLNSQGIVTDVLCSNHTRTTEITENLYKIYRASTFKVVASTPISPKLISILKKIKDKYDIIHVHLPNPMANLALFLTRPKAKIILHWHSDIIKQKFILKFYSPLQKWLLQRADSVVITTPTYLEGSKTLQNYHQKVTYIPIGIDYKEFPINQTFLEHLKRENQHKKVILSLGRLVYYKGFEYLIESAKYLPKNFLILIIGEGHLQEKLQHKINEKQLQHKVKLLGKVPFNELGAYYQLCDIFCMPSTERSEAFGVVQIEAMAFEKPIVSTNIKGSGVAWVNKDNISGKIVEPKNPKTLADTFFGNTF